jgi:hypothetical protein
MSYTFRDFAFQVYRLINASNPTISLHGDDEKLCLQVANQLLQSYAGNGLMITIAKTVSCNINISKNIIRFVSNNYPTETVERELVVLTTASPSFTVANGTIYNVGDVVTGNGIPALSAILSIDGNVITLNNNATITGSSTLTFTQPVNIPNVTFIKQGRLANLDNAWLLLSGVTYPLINKSRDEFLAAWKYEPLQGLPRFAIVFSNTEYTDIQLYPAPSQFYQFFARCKLQASELTKDSDMNFLPQYYLRYFLFATARDVCMYKGRAEAWTPKLEQTYQEAYDIMVSTSEVNLSIAGDQQSLLNGAWRVRAGI